MQAARKKGETRSLYKVINMIPLSAVDSYREHPCVGVVTQKVVGNLWGGRNFVQCCFHKISLPKTITLGGKRIVFYFNTIILLYL